jgi:hypothetical protein
MGKLGYGENTHILLIKVLMQQFKCVSSQHTGEREMSKLTEISSDIMQRAHVVDEIFRVPDMVQKVI